MERDQRLALIVGTFVVGALAAFAAVILSLSAESGLFATQYTLVARFDGVLGLQPNAPVWLAGKDVGRVDSVSFTPLGASEPLEVILRIDTDVQELIRSDSVASIGTIGVLGDSYVELRIGTLDAAPLRGGDSIQTVTPVGLGAVIDKGARALDSIGQLTEGLNDVVAGFTDQAGGEKAAQAVTAVSDMMISIREGEGLLHSLIYDQYEGGGVESIERSLASLDHILKEVRVGEGLLHSLIYEPTTDQDLIVEALEAGARLNSILAKVDRGEGTFGLLLNDPTLYEDLKILVGGAQRSAVLRSLIRMATDADP